MFNKFSEGYTTISKREFLKTKGWIQLAIDLLNKEEAAKLAQKVEEYVDIVEIGTPIVINEGVPAVQHLNENINNAKVLADLKIMDAADYEVSQAVKYGADIVTILGVAEDASIKAAVEEAHKHGKALLVDDSSAKLRTTC